MPVRCGFTTIVLLGLTLLTGRLNAVSAQQQSQAGPPSPIQMNLTVTATPTGTAVSWRAVTGATRYVVHRWKREGNGSRCCELHAQVGTALGYVDPALPGAGTYVYRVVAHLSGGRRYQERTLQVAAPASAQAGGTGSAPTSSAPSADPSGGTPTATIATDLPPDLAYRAPRGGAAPALPTPDQPIDAPRVSPSTGMVAVTDPPVPSSGPTAPADVAVQMPDRRTRTTVPIQLTDAPAGDGGARPAASGRYLVTAVGLYAGSVTTDNLLHEDGKGDEVFAAAVVRRYDRRTAQLLESTNRQTTVYGDVHGRVAERAQAGRLSPTGGIGNGDPIPLNPQAVRTVQAQERVFPWKLWDGTLTEGADAVVISPSVWEYDGRPGLYQSWLANQDALAGTLFIGKTIEDHIAAQTFAPLALGATEASHPRWLNEARLNAPAVVSVAFGLPPIFNLEGQDRPIGIVPGPSLPNTAIVLTREIIEAALARPPLGVAAPAQGVIVPLPKPGMLVVSFEDRWQPSFTDRKAFYSLVLQVERVP